MPANDKVKHIIVSFFLVLILNLIFTLVFNILTSIILSDTVTISIGIGKEIMDARDKADKHYKAIAWKSYFDFGDLYADISGIVIANIMIFMY